VLGFSRTNAQDNWLCLFLPTLWRGLWVDYYLTVLDWRDERIINCTNRCQTTFRWSVGFTLVAIFIFNWRAFHSSKYWEIGERESMHLLMLIQVFGGAIFFVLPDSPASAKWLTERERKFLVDRYLFLNFYIFFLFISFFSFTLYRYRAHNTESHTISLSLSRQQWITMLKTTFSDKYPQFSFSLL
jgi:hypothetical protein